MIAPSAAAGAAALPRPSLAQRVRGLPNLLLIGLLGLVALVICTAFTDALAGFDAEAQSLSERLLPPLTDGHLLGTDKLGRDLFARVLHGFRWSLPVGFLAAVIATLLGTVIGVSAGWSENWVRTALTRLIDLGISFPYFVLATAVIAIVGRGFWTLVLVLGLVAWVSMARVIYAETRALKEREYILAARLMGVAPLRIVATYVLRGLRHRIMVMFAFVFADLLVAEAALSFLGIGAPVGTPSWGNMLFTARENIFSAPWMLWAPALAVVLAVVTANFIGDGLNDHWSVGIEQE
jgi:peptide/nickel transport system permease protein